MDINIRSFFNACNPSRTLVTSNPEDKQYYINFAEVRGGPVINSLARPILLSDQEKYTCQLFTGHIGCGKSTELRELERCLREKGFYVAFCDSMQDLGQGDIEISDILLSITHQITESLAKAGFYVYPQRLAGLFQEVADFLGAPVTFEEGKFSLPGGLAEITAKIKDDVKLRSRVQNFLDGKVSTILDSINHEILAVATTQLNQASYQGLVVIVDNLEKMSSINLTLKISQPEYIFIDRGNELRKLNCHVVYTVPLALTFSRRFQELVNNFGGGDPPITLPMVPVKFPDGSPCEKGMKLLRRMVLKRAFPQVAAPEAQPELVLKVFDSPETLDRLCEISGGHVRTLMGLLWGCLKKADPPLTREGLEGIIREHQHFLARSIEPPEWEMLRQVVQQKSIIGEQGHDTLLRSLFVFEYWSEQGRWFDLNPALKETETYKSWSL